MKDGAELGKVIAALLAPPKTRGKEPETRVETLTNLKTAVFVDEILAFSQDLSLLAIKVTEDSEFSG